MKIGLLFICFFRYEEIKESIESIIETIDFHDDEYYFYFLELNNPNSDKVTQSLQSIVYPSNVKVKKICHFDINHVTNALLSVTQKLPQELDFITITETDIRLQDKNTIRVACELLIENPKVGMISPEYKIINKYHQRCINIWTHRRNSINENLNTTSGQGFQLLVFKSEIWKDYCNYVMSSKNVIEDTVVNKWLHHQHKIIGIMKNYFMVHTGWDVYNPEKSSDPEYLDYKNRLKRDGKLWRSPSVGNAIIIDYKVNEL